MKALLYPVLFISVIGYGQIDSLYKQMELDSAELMKTQLRIDSMKLELDSLRCESEKTQMLIDKLKQENIQLAKLMEMYLEQINRKQEEFLKKEE
ncbi:hypothetical protein D3C71_532820 [compost metagenome]